jgi:hypothetical protein
MNNKFSNELKKILKTKKKLLPQKPIISRKAKKSLNTPKGLFLNFFQSWF